MNDSIPRNTFPRRTFLRGSGLALALPAFESLAHTAGAAPSVPTLQTAAGTPLRMVYVYVPNGVNVDRWQPRGEGTDFELGPTLSTLNEHKSDITVVSGLEHKAGYIHRDGAGDHARAMSNFLTGARAHKTAGADIHLGTSVDQVAARSMDGITRLSSLELSCDGVRKAGACDSGYSCVYQYNMAWRSPTQPVAPESNPRLVFERLFGHGKPGTRQANFMLRREQRRSMLDFLRDEAASMKHQLGANDRVKLDEYLEGVRSVEQRIEMSEKYGPPADPSIETPDGIPDSYAKHIGLLFDVMTLAMETDSTRICTFMLAHDGSNRSFSEIGVNDGHHDLSHHKKDAERLEKIAKIDAFYVEQFETLLTRLKSRKDTDGRTLLENSMVVYGSGLSDGDRHSHKDLPVLVAGQAGGQFQTGRHLKLEADTPMSNLYLTMLNKAGVGVDSFSDSTGQIEL